MDRPEIMAERKRNGFVSVADVIRADAKRSAVIKALKRGKLTVEEIAEDNDLSLDEVLKIQKELS